MGNKIGTSSIAPMVAGDEQPQQQFSNADAPAAKWKVRTLGLFAALLPGLFCYFCLGYTYIVEHDQVLPLNITVHCASNGSRVEQHTMLPPVSYTIGVFTPQKYIWLMVVALHLPPRLFYIYTIMCTNNHYYGQSLLRRKIGSGAFDCLRRVHYICLMAETVAVVVLSVIDVGDKLFVIHVAAFNLWLLAFNANMLFDLVLAYHSPFRTTKKSNSRVFRAKCLICLIGFPTCWAIPAFYFAFTRSCRLEFYSAFAIAEMVVIGVNCTFYFLLIWEFKGAKVEVYVRHKN